MPKIIRLTPAMREQCEAEFNETLEKLRKNFREAVSGQNIQNGKLNLSCGSFTKTFEVPDRKARVHFTEAAWLKMRALIDEFSSEVAWHGTAYRDADETKDDYYITDIFVYPQEVSGATVNTDQAGYETWLYSLNDEQFNNLRMQGHSHVNMGVTPSSVDENHQERILNQLEGDMFYIFMIWNKSLANNIRIYDLKKNILFESKDVEVYTGSELLGLDTFIREAKGQVKTKSFTSYYQGKAPQVQKTYAKEAASPAPVPANAAVGKQKTFASGSSASKLDGYDDDDDYDSAFGYYDGFFRRGKR